MGYSWSSWNTHRRLPNLDEVQEIPLEDFSTEQAQEIPLEDFLTEQAREIAFEDLNQPSKQENVDNSQNEDMTDIGLPTVEMINEEGDVNLTANHEDQTIVKTPSKIQSVRKTSALHPFPTLFGQLNHLLSQQVTATFLLKTERLPHTALCGSG